MVVFTGTTIEEAKEKARVQLKPTLNQTIEFAVLQQPRHGFLGIGRRQAQVDAVIKDKEIAMPSLEEKDEQPAKEPEQKPASLSSAEDELILLKSSGGNRPILKKFKQLVKNWLNI